MCYTSTQFLEKLRQFKMIPVIALDNDQDILPLGKVLSSSGLPIAEVTFRSPIASKAIHLLREAYPEMIIAAGTVLTKEQVMLAKDAGADLIITPGFNPNIVRFCQNLGMPIVPGVNNPMAIEAALEMGIATVKFFPAEASGGVKMIKALLGPYSHLQIIPTGGISIDNINEYLAIPNVVACGGSWFVEKSLIQCKDWDKITVLVKEALVAVN